MIILMFDKNNCIKILKTKNFGIFYDAREFLISKRKHILFREFICFTLRAKCCLYFSWPINFGTANVFFVSLLNSKFQVFKSWIWRSESPEGKPNTCHLKLPDVNSHIGVGFQRNGRRFTKMDVKVNILVGNILINILWW